MKHRWQDVDKEIRDKVDELIDLLNRKGMSPHLANNFRNDIARNLLAFLDNYELIIVQDRKVPRCQR